MGRPHGGGGEGVCTLYIAWTAQLWREGNGETLLLMGRGGMARRRLHEAWGIRLLGALIVHTRHVETFTN